MATRVTEGQQCSVHMISLGTLSTHMCKWKLLYRTARTSIRSDGRQRMASVDWSNLCKQDIFLMFVISRWGCTYGRIEASTPWHQMLDLLPVTNYALGSYVWELWWLFHWGELLREWEGCFSLLRFTLSAAQFWLHPGLWPLSCVCFVLCLLLLVLFFVFVGWDGSAVSIAFLTTKMLILTDDASSLGRLQLKKKYLEGSYNFWGVCIYLIGNRGGDHLVFSCGQHDAW